MSLFTIGKYALSRMGGLMQNKLLYYSRATYGLFYITGSFLNSIRSLDLRLYSQSDLV